jgi:TonB family protein
MMERSGSRSHHLFITLFLVILTIHSGLLLLSWRESYDLSKPGTHRSEDRTDSIPLKVVYVKKSLLPVNLHQIVDSEDPAEFKKPKDSKFLSDKDRIFDRETLSRNTAPFQKGSHGSTAASAGKGSKKEITLSALGQIKDHDPMAAAAKEYAKRGNKSATVPGRDISSTSDYVENVPLGDLTHLNTQEYVYYGFYHRIKIKLEQFWGRSIQEKAEQLQKSGRHIASEENLITALRITLDQQGEILAIAVVGPSGIRELDDAAIESFNQAGPFPNPPKGMVVDGKVTLEWGFVVKS